MLLSMGISFLITTAINKIVELKNEADNIIQKGKDAKKEIDEITTKLDEQTNTTQTLGKRYAELRKGVKLTADGFQNISLSDTEYKEFLSINQQIVDLYP